MASNTAVSATAPSRPLRVWLGVDAGACGTTGALLMAGSPWLTALLGYPAGFLLGAGAFLIVFAAGLTVLATGRGLTVPAVRAVVGTNVAWVLGSLLLAVSGAFGPALLGLGVVVFQAAAVAVVTVAETVTLGRARPVLV